jgi:uncharacterized protein YjbI with pentapeptide repeats
LRTSQRNAEVRKVARTRTISVLRQLDARRVGDVFTFLREAGLTETSDPVVSLKNADFSNVKWDRANLSKTNLSGAYLWEAHLKGANLSEATLSEANLSKTNLSGAYLWEANLHRALQPHLFGAIFS